MSLFKECEGEVVILACKGIYKQVPVYVRNGYLFGKVGSGFVRLMADGSTTQPGTRIDTLLWEGSLGKDKFGRLCNGDKPDAIPLEGPVMKRLLALEGE